MIYMDDMLSWCTATAWPWPSYPSPGGAAKSAKSTWFGSLVRKGSCFEQPDPVLDPTVQHLWTVAVRLRHYDEPHTNFICLRLGGALDVSVAFPFVRYTITQTASMFWRRGFAFKRIFREYLRGCFSWTVLWSHALDLTCPPDIQVLFQYSALLCWKHFFHLAKRWVDDLWLIDVNRLCLASLFDFLYWSMRMSTLWVESSRWSYYGFARLSRW